MTRVFTGMRWFILGLLFFATTINYLDRAVLGIILPEIRDRFHLTLQAYGTIQMMFQIAYGVGSLLSGRLLDRYGTKIGFGTAVALWSGAAMLSALARTTFHFGMYRTLLGLGEAANFPACNKVVAEWFPPENRATAMAVVNAGPNLANIVGPPLVILIALKWGWQMCFLILGGLGLVWIPFWILLFHSPVRIGPWVQVSKISLRAVLKYKQTWGYAFAKFLTDPVWWFYLFWLPTYLSDVRHFTPAQRGTALMIVYSISGVGALGGGFIADFLVKRGWRIGRARKTTMLFCAVAMPLFGLGVIVEDAQLAVLLFGLATAAHQAWMTNLFTVPSDIFPARAVGSASGFGVGVGALGGALFSGIIPGTVIPSIGYVPVLLTMNCFYLIAWLTMHRMLGNLDPVTPDE